MGGIDLIWLYGSEEGAAPVDPQYEILSETGEGLITEDDEAIYLETWVDTTRTLDLENGSAFALENGSEILMEAA
jgi:hypothetical protein